MRPTKASKSKRLFKDMGKKIFHPFPGQTPATDLNSALENIKKTLEELHTIELNKKKGIKR